MPQLIDFFPGVRMPVDEVTETLRHMWDRTPGTGDNPSDFHASQLNLILHFGLETTREEALTIFDSTIRFAQRYPCRIVVLCPSDSMELEGEFEGKLFSQCYLGKHLRDICCCEALILGYSPEQSDFLESQVSIWLESDLPVYHWLHRVPVKRITSHYLTFIARCRGVLFDSAVEGKAYESMEWPYPTRVKDLAFARTLPLRQHIGQFLSGFKIEELTSGLKELDFKYSEGLSQKVMHLLRWHQKALQKALSGDIKAFESLKFSDGSFDDNESGGDCIRIDWKFEPPGKYLSWRYSSSRKSGHISGRLSSGNFAHPLHIVPLSPEGALAEALFFV